MKRIRVGVIPQVPGYETAEEAVEAARQNPRIAAAVADSEALRTAGPVTAVRWTADALCLRFASGPHLRITLEAGGDVSWVASHRLPDLDPSDSECVRLAWETPDLEETLWDRKALAESWIGRRLEYISPSDFGLFFKLEGHEEHEEVLVSALRDLDSGQGFLRWS